MEQKFLELFTLKYKKILNSSQIMYKTLASYNEMAFSMKKMLKEADLYIQALIVKSLINSNELNIDILRRLNEISEYSFAFKKVNLKKIQRLDDETICKVSLISDEILKNDPLFIKVASYFDKIIKKVDSAEKLKGCNIIAECLLSMLFFVRNQDDKDHELKYYQKDIEIIYNYIER